MTKYIVKHTKLFKKDYKLALKRKLNIELLQNVISKLANGKSSTQNIMTTPCREIGLVFENVISCLIGYLFTILTIMYWYLLFPAPGHIVIYSKIAFLTTHR